MAERDYQPVRTGRWARARVIASDRLAAGAIRAGGLGVILALLLIILYLLSQAAPLFRSPAVAPLAEYPLPAAGAGPTVYLGFAGWGGQAVRVTAAGQVVLFSPGDGAVARLLSLDLPPAARVVQLAADSGRSERLAAGLADGSVIVFEVGEGDVPGGIVYPLGRSPLALLPDAPIEALALASADEGVLLFAAGQGAAVAALAPLVAGGPVQTLVWDSSPPAAIVGAAVAPDGRRLVLRDGAGALWPVLRSGRHLLPGPAGRAAEAATGMTLLAGGRTLVSASAAAGVRQWLLQEADGALSLQPVQALADGASLRLLVAESERKGLAGLDGDGGLWLIHVTSGRSWRQPQLTEAPAAHMALSGDARQLLLETADGRVAQWQIVNPHPEVSWRALWGRLRYEDYAVAAAVWQPAGGGVAAEPKLGLAPLVFGTLKAAAVALLLALPLAVGGAIYTAHFMEPGMRRYIKPMVELMEALPTVILGFLAALWLAPLLESNLLGALLAALLWPLLVLVVAGAWHGLPVALSHRLPAELRWLFLPLLLLAFFAACFAVSPLLEVWLFGGDFTLWLSRDLGLQFQQRNALVIGIALGFAIVPSIFSIAEDAIFSVPPHLTQGALALGARPWQALVGVVLPVAGPAILSAAMIGFGRALGETMIVLMASGNTPLLDVNLFEGLRSVAANVALEVTETEPGSTHYRVLYLSGLVLLGFSLLCNTPAELLRQRMRRRFRNL